MTRDLLESAELVERWRELNRQQSRVRVALDRALQRKHGVSACELDVLQLIAEADDGLRIQDVCERVQRSQGALSRMVGRLESEDLVTRTTYPSDRRGVVVRLTDAGRQRIDTAAITQQQVLADTLP